MKKVILLAVFMLGSMSTVFGQTKDSLSLSYDEKKILTPTHLKKRGFIIPLYSEIDFDSKIVTGQVIERHNGNNWILACTADKAEKGKTLNYDYLDVSELHNDTLYRVTFTKLDEKKYIIFFKSRDNI